MGNYLLFGGSGFIGHHLANQINKSSKVNPYIFDIEATKTENVIYEKVDVRRNINTNYKPSENDVIFNLAAVHRTPGHPSKEYFETNILGAEKVCDYATRHNINTILFTSSIATYGCYEEQKHEETPLMPDIPYGISKVNAEFIHKLWQAKDPANRKLIIIRPGVVFGENEKGNFTRLINSIAKNRFFYPGRKDTIKACIYVKDLVSIMSQMIENSRVGVSTYNMTYEPAPRIDEISKIISEQGGLLRPNIKLPSILLLLVSKIAYGVLRINGLHPDRVRKLMVSNNINGAKMNTEFKLEYGLNDGIADWMKSTGFPNSSKFIY